MKLITLLIVVDRNEFRGSDIFVKPNRSINFIQLQFVATRSNVAFEEVINKKYKHMPNINDFKSKLRQKSLVPINLE